MYKNAVEEEERQRIVNAMGRTQIPGQIRQVLEFSLSVSNFSQSIVFIPLTLTLFVRLSLMSEDRIARL